MVMIVCRAYLHNYKLPEIKKETPNPEDFSREKDAWVFLPQKSPGSVCGAFLLGLVAFEQF